MKTIIIVFLMLSCFYLRAQTYINYTPSASTSGVATMNASINSDNEIIGSIYLFKDWKHSAKIYTTRDNVIQVENINFNAKDGTFASKMSKDSIFIFHGLKKVELEGRRFDIIASKFYEVLYVFDDDQMFVKKHVVVAKPELHHITSTVIGPGKYVFEDEYYVYKNNDLVKFWPSKKNVLDLLNAEKALVSKQAKIKKLSYSKEEDLLELFQYYDTL